MEDEPVADNGNAIVSITSILSTLDGAVNTLLTTVSGLVDLEGLLSDLHLETLSLPALGKLGLLGL